MPIAGNAVDWKQVATLLRGELRLQLIAFLAMSFFIFFTAGFVFSADADWDLTYNIGLQLLIAAIGAVLSYLLWRMLLPGQIGHVSILLRTGLLQRLQTEGIERWLEYQPKSTLFALKHDGSRYPNPRVVIVYVDFADAECLRAFAAPSALLIGIGMSALTVGAGFIVDQVQRHQRIKEHLPGLFDQHYEYLFGLALLLLLTAFIDLATHRAALCLALAQCIEEAEQ